MVAATTWWERLAYQIAAAVMDAILDRLAARQTAEEEKANDEDRVRTARLRAAALVQRLRNQQGSHP